MDKGYEEILSKWKYKCPIIIKDSQPQAQLKKGKTK